MVRFTSLITYREITKDGTLGEMQAKVYQAFKNHPNQTDREITRLMGLSDPNNVRPRRKELVQHGYLIETGKRKCGVTHRKAITWAPAYQQTIIHELRENID